jgi:hypothetical protein
MVFERTGNHHAALTRHVPLGPINDVSRFARRDPMRLPDLHLRQAVATAGTGSQERERLNFGERGLDEPEVRRFDANGQPESAVDLPPRPARNTRKQLETTAREYIERSRAGARQYQEPVRRPSPQRERVSTRYISESEHIERRDPRPAVAVKRASGRTHESKLFGRPGPVVSSVPHHRALQREYTPRAPNSEDSNMPSITLSRPWRFGLLCQTVSRDETSSEDAKISSFVKTAMEPHARKARVFRSDTTELKSDVGGGEPQNQDGRRHSRRYQGNMQ